MSALRFVKLFLIAAGIAVAITIASPSFAQAAPFAVSDTIPPNASGDKATHCGFRYGAAARVDVPVAVDGSGNVSCNKSLLDVPVGSTQIDATSVLIKPGFPRVESASASNVITVNRAAVPVAATGLALALCGTTACVQSAAVPAGVTDCGWAVDGGTRTFSPPVSGKCQTNAVLTAGAHTATLLWRAADPLFGPQDGAQSAPFTWSVPTPPAAPASLRAVTN